MKTGVFKTVRQALLCGIALSFVSLDTAAVAQASPEDLQSPFSPDQASVPDSSSPGDSVGPRTDIDIVVTAQRRSERLSRVPVSVLAFDSEMLQTKVIISEQDVGTIVPGLVVKNGQTANQLSYSMRGQTLDPFSGTSPAVLPYLNEVPYSPYNTATSFFDLQSLQVLKGPQGTLFGRNATGGAVLYTTPVPGDRLAGNLIVRAGQRETFQLQGAIDLPLVRDLLAVRLAGDISKENGFMRNRYTGNTLGDRDSRSGRATILLTPTPSLKNITLFQYDYFGGTEGQGNIYTYYTTPNAAGQQFVNNGRTSILNTNGTLLTSTLDTVYNVFSGLLFNLDGHNIGDSNLTPGPTYGPGRFPGGVEGNAAYTRANPFDIYLQFDLPHKSKNTFVSNTTEFDFGDSLTIKNIASYNHTDTTMPTNLAGGPFGALWTYNNPNNPTGPSGEGPPGGQRFIATTYTEELQLQGKALDDRLRYTVGGFYSHFQHSDTTPVHVGAEIDPNAGAAAAFGLPVDVAYSATAKDISRAIYAQFDFDLTNRLKFTAGGRYTWETVSLRQNPGSVFIVTGVTTADEVQRRNLSDPSWTFNLQYQIDSSNMVYIAQRGSFRSGNFNTVVLPLNDANFFANENAIDVELGYKFSGRLGTMPARFNVAAYMVRVTDAQHAIYAIVSGNPAGFTVNVPEKETKGVEVDWSIQVTPWLGLNATGAYTDARYTKGVVDVSNLTGVPGSTIRVDSYPDTPKWSGTFGADLTLPVPENIGTVILHGDVYGQTHTYFSSAEGSITPGTRLKGYTIANVRLSWNNVLRSNFSLAVYAKNVFDRFYYASGYALGAAGGYNTAYPGAPRTVAAELSVRF
jgi:iron complex outermembrane recepter protein